jgi:GntR family transcriptional regulator
LALRPETPFCKSRRVLSFGGMCPPFWKTCGCPAAPFKGLTAERLADYHGPMYALFETEFGVRMVRAKKKSVPCCPTKSQRDLLQLPPNTPLLSVERIAYTYNDTPMELRRGLYSTEPTITATP